LCVREYMLTNDDISLAQIKLDNPNHDQYFTAPPG